MQSYKDPLATVAIGGLMTSILLTPLLISSIYSWFENRKVEVNYLLE
ncbi:MAG: hypothetical protein M5T52_23345 [Ignavibacteriaceae bacterium]|nr:hypothetical protein [Ignavibacteriaceae bacterium]